MFFCCLAVDVEDLAANLRRRVNFVFDVLDELVAGPVQDRHALRLGERADHGNRIADIAEDIGERGTGVDKKNNKKKTGFSFLK
jgi:hypothetical protein